MLVCNIVKFFLFNQSNLDLITDDQQTFVLVLPLLCCLCCVDYMLSSRTVGVI